MWLANAVEGLAEQSAEPLKMQRDWRRAMQIDEAREFIKFLHGAVPWNGTWFGEYAPGERGAYWWRKHLDEAIAALIAAPAAPQQAEPVEQIGWADEFGNLFQMGAWKPAQRTHHDSHKTAWRAVYLHAPAAEVQMLRAAARDVCEWADAAQWALGNETGVPAAKLDALRAACWKGVSDDRYSRPCFSRSDW